MSRKLVLFILISSLLVILPVSIASSQFISCDENLNNFNVEVSDPAVHVAVPFHYQSNNYYCGPAALEMVFDYYGEDVPQTEIADVARTCPYETYTDELRRAAHFSNLSTSLGDELPGNITGYSAREIGYAAFEHWGLTIDDLRFLINKGEPLIVLMWWTSSKVYGHYRVVVGYNETHIIMHDPWNKNWGGTYGGANITMTYSTFLDLWEYIGNWGLWVHPWEIELKMPSTASKEDDFEVIANITYPCSTPFDIFDYPASSCKATIELQEGLELAWGETAQHYLGSITAGNSVQTSWSIHASETGFCNISVTVAGMVEGGVGAHGTYPSYDYEDEIGGSCINSLSIINQTYRVHNIDTGLNYTTIQEAINAPETLDGHTILVEEGTYYEHVVVNKTLTLVGADETSTIIDGDGKGTVVEVTADGVAISNFTIINSGLYPYSPPDTGLRLINTDNCLISNNTIKNCFHAIFMLNSSRNTLRNNQMFNNSYGFVVLGLELHHFINDIDSSNTIDGKLAYYLINQRNLTVNPSTFPNTGYLALINSTGITVENLTFNKVGQGILFAYTTYSTIKAIRTEDNYLGIILYSSDNNSVLCNNLTRNWEGSIFLLLSEDNIISHNVISLGNQYGVLLGNSSNNLIANNKISYIEHDGIWISGSSNNILYNNTLESNCYSAIELRYSADNNTILCNNIINNLKGIKIEDSSFNRIFHNNFIQNEWRASSTSLNFWDDGYPSGGNFWSDYAGVDLHSGLYQNKTGSDGIGDTVYPINFDNQDNYPLIGISYDFEVIVEYGELYHVHVVSNSTVRDLEVLWWLTSPNEYLQPGQKFIHLSVAGEGNTTGFCRLTIPRMVLNGTYIVLVDWEEVPANELEESNTTHSYLYFTYQHSEHEVVIVPEFSTFIILVLFMMATLLTVVFYRKNHSLQVQPILNLIF